MQSLQQEKQQNSESFESNQQKSSAPYINEKRHIGVNNNNRTTLPPGTTTGATSRSQTSSSTTTAAAAAASFPSISKSTTNTISTPFDSIAAAAPQLVLSDSNSYNNSSTATMSQSDAHSVSSGFSNNSTVQQQTSIATSTIPPPIVQNPFESLSPAPKTSIGVPGVSSNMTSNIPPTHVAIRMQQQPQHVAVQPTTMQSIPQSPMRVGPIANTTRTSTSTPTQPAVSIGSQTQYKQSIPLASSATGIPSPVSHPSTVTQSPQTFRPASDTSYNYPMFDSSSQQQTNIRPSNNYQMNNNNDFMFDDDENTAPSSLGNATDEQSQQQQLDPSTSNYPTSISSNSLTSRIIESTKRLISTTATPLNSDHTNPATTTTTMSILASQQNQQCLISGYLEKFGRNNKWQTRWFETNGIYLSYYKSSKRSKLLATLDLQKVGLIEIDTDDKTEHSFRIQVLGRLYQLRANSRASCQDWVITLNRIKEARMQQGNVKLVGMPTKSTTGTTSPMDLLNGPNTVGATSSVASTQQNPNNFLDGTPRVVVVSNRERTHGVDEEDQWDEMIRIDDGQNITLGGTTLNETDVDPASGHQQVETIYGNNKRLSSIGTVVAARWTKHHSTFQRLGNKLSKWARSIKKYSCIDADAVVTGGGPHHNTQQNYGDVVHLDKYLHPPGHDDKLNKQRQQQQHQQQQQQRMKMQPPMSTAGTNSSNIPMHTTPSMTVSSNINTTTAVTVNKPLPIVDRSISSTSDYDVRMLS